MNGRGNLRRLTLLLACSAVLVCVPLAQAEPLVYRCVDAKGRVTYTQTGCDPASAQRRLDERTPAEAPGPPGQAVPAEPEPSARETPARRPSAPIRRTVGAQTDPQDGASAAAKPASPRKPAPHEQSVSVHPVPDTELEMPDHSSRRAAPR